MIKKLISLFTLIALLTLICISCKSLPDQDLEAVSEQTTSVSESGTSSAQTTTVSGTETSSGQTIPASGSGTSSGQTSPVSGSGTASGQTTSASGSETASGQTTSASESETASVQIPPANSAALMEAINRAKEARNRAIDFNSSAYFPVEWEAAEKLYVAAGKAPVSTLSEILQAAAMYDAAADAYDALYRKAIPLYAQTKEDEIISARNELIKTGFTDLFPQYLQSADETALAAKDQYEAGDYYKAKDTAAEALKEYEDLLLGAKVYLARQEIIDNGFIVYDFDSLEKADEIALAAKAEYDAGNREQALAKAKEALLLYNTLLAKGQKEYASDQWAFAGLERELAIAEKANIASRELFNKAEVLYNRAARDFSSGNFLSAANLYAESTALFSIARRDTEEKRLKALETIKLADEKISESNEAALEAERIIEGGSI